MSVSIRIVVLKLDDVDTCTPYDVAPGEAFHIKLRETAWFPTPFEGDSRIGAWSRSPLLELVGLFMAPQPMIVRTAASRKTISLFICTPQIKIDVVKLLSAIIPIKIRTSGPGFSPHSFLANSRLGQRICNKRKAREYRSRSHIKGDTGRKSMPRESRVPKIQTVIGGVDFLKRNMTPAGLVGEFEVQGCRWILIIA